MILKKGEPRYKFPPHSQVMHVTIGDRKRIEIVYQIQIIPIGDLTAVEKAEEDRPRYCAIYNNIIEFEPTPDKDYVATAIYAPPLKRW